MASTTLKTYRAHSMAQALAEVKKDLGAEAVILHTRTYKTGGVMGFGGRTIVEITASNDSRAAARAARPRHAHASGEQRRAREPGAQPSEPRAEPRPGRPVAPRTGADAGQNRDDPGSPGAEVRGEPSRRTGAQVTAQGQRAAPSQPQQRSPASEGATRAVQGEEGFQPFEPEHFDLRQPAHASPGARVHRSPKVRFRDLGDADHWSGQEQAPTGAVAAGAEEPAASVGAGLDRQRTARLSVAAMPNPADESGRQALEEELASIKRLMGHVLQCSRRAAHASGPGVEGSGAGAASEPLSDAYLRMTDQCVSAALAEELIGRVRDELTPGELSDARIVQQALLRQIASRIGVAPDSRPAGGRLGTVALVGPTGVGKTTTLAKLAAAYKLRHGCRVALVTCDTYRIAAVEQLRTYANIIGLPVRVASTPQEMRTAIDAVSDHDAVLIDTPGRSQHDATRLDELREFIDATGADERHLVLSAAASEPVLERAAERFSSLGPDHLLVTKLDEAVVHGPVLNIAARLGLPLGFVTNGQEVPDHLERANADRIARLIVGPGAESQAHEHQRGTGGVSERGAAAAGGVA